MSTKPDARSPMLSVACAAAVALTGAYAPAALAQNAVAGLEEIIVTARKREETLLEIPQEIQAISQQEMKRANLRTSQDLERFIPSLTSNQNDAGIVSIFFRGVAEGTASLFSDSSAAVYLDEQPLTWRTWQPEVRLVDMERIEALPGPQGTLYGAGSQSGTLRYITNKPDPAGFHADVSFNGYTMDHGDEGYELSSVLNLPLGSKTAIRLVGFSARDAGYIDNVLGQSLGGTFDNSKFVESDANAVEYLGGRAAVRWLAGEHWTIDVGMVFQQLDSGVYSDQDISRAGRELASVQFLDDDHSDDWTQLALTLRGDLGWGELTSATSYFKRDITDFRDRSDETFFLSNFVSNPTSCAQEPTFWDCAFAFAADPVSHGSTKGHGDRVAQEFRLRGATETVTWLAGLFYEHTTDGGHDFRYIENYEDTQAFDYWNSEYGVQPGTTDNADSGFKDKADTRQMATFGEVSYSPDKRWTFTAGLRWFDHEREREYLSQQPKGRVSSFDKVKASTSEIAKKLSVQYNFNEIAMVYALYSEGFRAGGRNLTAPGVVLPLDYVPDFMDNYELGFKSRWDGGRYTFNFTRFKMKWKDYQAEIVDPGAFPDYLVFMVENIGDAEIEGISAEFTAYLWDSLDFGLNAEFLDPRVTQGHELVGTEDGDRLPFSPEEKGAVWVDYTFPREVAGGHVYGRFQWTYTGHRLNGVGQEASLQPAYQIADFKVGVETEGWEIYVYVDNLTDERAIIRDWTGVPQGPVSINPLRTWGLGFSMNWGGT
jgi:outer membrane receptor protein involved in Fe transport